MLIQNSRLSLRFSCYVVKRHFASIDPYYILGIDRKMEYEEIKKHYFKLASQYHPDKNPSPDANKQFMVIKEAFEMIKGLKGKTIKIDENFKGDPNFQSVRPNPEQYKEDFKEEFQDKETGEKMDYKEFYHKTPDNEEFSKFKQSFKEMEMMKNIKFNPDNVAIPDPSRRFDLKSQNLLKKKFSDSTPTKFIGAVVGIFCLIVYAGNKMLNDTKNSNYQNVLYNMLNKSQYDEYTNSEEETRKHIAVNLEKHQEFKEYKKKIDDKSKHQEYIMDRNLPKFNSFINISDLENSEE